MRVSFVTETWPPQVNGVALTVRTLAAGLAARGLGVDVVRPGGNGRDGKVELVIGVDYDSDLPFVARLLKDVADRQPGRLAAPAPVVGYTDFADSSINAKVLIWTLPSQTMSAKSALIMDIKAEFDKHGINIPFPHQVTVQPAAPLPQPTPQNP